MKHEITITTNNPIRIGRIIAPFLLQVGVIGIGVATDSQAMQWSGFIMLALFSLVSASKLGKKNRCLTIEQAHKRLEEIEAETRQ